MAVGAFAGHLLAPGRVADHYGWVSDRWYQCEIGAFNAGLGYGIATVAEDAAVTGRTARAGDPEVFEDEARASG